MSIPVALFDVSISVAVQDSAPSYAVIKSIFDVALSNALDQLDPSRVLSWIGPSNQPPLTFHWAGPGPRVTRKVREGAVPGGVVRAVALLVSDTPTTLSTDQVQSMLVAMTRDILAQYNARVTTTAIDQNVVAYSAAMNGPIEFWDSGQATVTHTRERFPTTNTIGTPSTDQNENPIGPSDPRLVPSASPPWLPSLPSLTTFLIVAGVIVAAGGLVYFFWPTLTGARKVQAELVRANPRPRVRPKARRRPSRMSTAA